MKSPSGKMVRNLWWLTAAIFALSLVVFLAVAGKNTPTLRQWCGFDSLVDGVFAYCLGGCCLIPVPFAIAAIVVTLIRARIKPEDTDSIPRLLKVFFWIIGILIIGLAVLCLVCILMLTSSA
jgi:hypothetical protein